MSGIKFKISNLLPKYAFTNRIYVRQDVFRQLAREDAGDVINCRVTGHGIPGEWFFQVTHASDTNLPQDEIGMNAVQRGSMSVTLGQEVLVEPYEPLAAMTISVLSISVDLLRKTAGGTQVKLDAAEISETFKAQFEGQIFRVSQKFVMNFKGEKLDLAVSGLDHVNIGHTGGNIPKNCGHLIPNITSIAFSKREGSTTPLIIIAPADGVNSNLFRQDFDFEKMGIGGLGKEFEVIFRRAFASRLFPGLMREVGQNHCRGMLLYGPPGCGKTLIARQIGKVLNSKPPKIVTGPEVLDKYVGGSEAKVRELFADAEKDQLELGDRSMLHIIILDEMDAIMKARGSTSDNTGVSDNVVNQFLSKIDGPESLNNILIIGMTNRKDLIDEAVLRAGRLEVHIEIPLPDEAGRLQILNIHTKKMKESRRMTPACIQYIPQIAALSQNYTGSEIEELVRSAFSFALTRNIDTKNLKAVNEADIIVDIPDFERAIAEKIPQFGQKDSVDMSILFRNGIYNYGPSFSGLMNNMERLINQTRNSVRTPLLTVLLEGPPGSGKTALAAKLANDSGFPFVRLVSPDSMIGMSEVSKCQSLLRTFSDAYRSPLSIIVMDDIERLIEYSPIGHRFLNSVLQTLLILLRKVPPKEGKRLMVIATTQVKDLLEDLQVTRAFSAIVNVSNLQDVKEYRADLEQDGGLTAEEINDISRCIPGPLGIKQLLMVLEMARSDSTQVSADHFLECLTSCGSR